MHKGISALLCLCGSVAPAAALDCKTAITTVDLHDCAAADFDRADAALNAAYRQLVAKLGDEPERKRALVEAQRAWVAFRNADCAFAATQAAGGSAAPLLELGCSQTLTERRTADLRRELAD